MTNTEQFRAALLNDPKTGPVFFRIFAEMMNETLYGLTVTARPAQ